MSTASSATRPDVAALDWAKFAELQGAPERNWEVFCYALVSRNYRHLGALSAQRQQPGVEFHLKVDTAGALGDPKSWWGWQCKWYDLGKDRSLGKRRREDIEDSLRKTEKHLPKLTDWVLWLRERPCKDDIDWFSGLKSSMRLHLWCEEDIETHLVGDATILREAYFGDLVFTPERLEEAFDASVEPVRLRWDPSLNVDGQVDRVLRRALIEAGSWDRYRSHADRIAERVDALTESLDTLHPDDRTEVETLCDDLRSLETHLRTIADSADDGDPAGTVLACRTPASLAMGTWSVRKLVARLRARRRPASLEVATAEADRVDALRLLDHASEVLAALAYGVVAEAGDGKSFLSAQLAASTEHRPAGVLMLGIKLANGHDLDNLARKVPLLGAQTFEQLINGVDAAGARAGRRLPIVIDGLNESERPSEWTSILNWAKPLLKRCPNVLLVATVRTSIADDVLPDYMERHDLRGFEENVEAAVERYFEHYKINPGTVRLPYRDFRRPLFLRLYCEATNYERAEVVGPEALPSSPVGVFRRYRDSAADRLRVRLNLEPGYVERALRNIAATLWERGGRSLPFPEVKQLVGDDPKEWDTSLARHMVEEGLLWRNIGSGPDDQHGALLFDAFAGFLIADGLLHDGTPGEALEQVRTPEFLAKAFGTAEDGRHELATDITFAMVDCLPRRTQRQLWHEAPEAKKRWTLAQTLTLDPELIDDETQTELERGIERMEPPRSYHQQRHVFDRLEEVFDSESHPLNATFLDRVLRPMQVARRDRLWTEWVRERHEEVLEELARSEEELRAHTLPANTAHLRVIWTAWLLTSPAGSIRDLATRWLYWYGRTHAKELFELTLRHADGNDPYVLERLIGASYGVLMAAHGNREEIGGHLTPFLDGIAERFVAPDATAPTSNHVVRDYLRGIVELARVLDPQIVPESLVGDFTFGDSPTLAVLADDSQESEDADATLHMDFENYTMGRVFKDRGNYQPDHERHVALVRAVRARVYDLGWRTALFGDIDSRISESQYRRFLRGAAGTERYGKKYGWIAFREEFGRIAQHEPEGLGYLDRLSEIGPDMSFPSPPPQLEDDGTDPFDQLTGEAWVRDGVVTLPTYLATSVDLDGTAMTPIEASAGAEHAPTKRTTWFRVRCILAPAADADRLVEALRGSNINNLHLSDPTEHSTFAGEIPWHPRFAQDVDYVEELWGLKIKPPVAVHGLIHDYSYGDGEHEWLGSAGSTALAAKPLWDAFDVRTLPQTFDGVTADGRRIFAALQLPETFDRASVLLMSIDALRQYAADQDMVIIRLAWGGRRMDFDRHDMPDWYPIALQADADHWHDVQVL